MSFRDQLKARREACGLTRAALAEQLGVSASAVGNYETGVSFPKEDVLLRLFDALRTDPNQLFCGSYRSGGFDLSGAERTLLEKYRSLSPIGRDTVRSVTDALCDYRDELTEERGGKREPRLIPLYNSPAAAGYADGDWRIAKDNLDLLQLWCSYLLTHGEDPGNQMCTDDFAGHLARNVNLSAKAVMGIAAFGMILDALGRGAEAKIYRDEAKRRANRGLEGAAVGDHTALTFDGQGWSLKYNLVWDKLFGLDLLPDSFYSQETKSYLARSNTYGIPLDSRSVLTKSDWLLWCAAMADADDFAAFLHPVARYVRETPSRVPFSDFYHSEDGVSARFIARTVQGGLYMPLLMDRWKKRRESAQK